MGERIIVLIATHKRYRMPTDEMYLPIQVGAEGKECIGYRRDDSGENISRLNPHFCELTGLYWAWKNLDSDYIGLVHYRRHFRRPTHAWRVWELILKKKDIEADLERYRVFVPKKRRYYIETLYSHYKHTHHIRQLDETRSIIADIYPEYLASFEKAVNRRWGYMFNMMIMEKHLVDQYCEWLFAILFELRNRLGEVQLSSFHSRYYGRISEIIFNAWLDEQIRADRIKETEIKEIPIIYTEKINWWNKGRSFILAKFMGKKYEKGF